MSYAFLKKYPIESRLMTVSYPQDLLASRLPQWHLLLQEWSASGRLTAAAQEALLLNGEPQALTDLTNQWSAKNFKSLPEIVLLSNADINGALGAYALSTGKIYLNAEWLATATQEAVNAVITEELGHHLDGKLNFVDTAGDEGENFYSLLVENPFTNETKESSIYLGSSWATGDSGYVRLGNELVEVEQASIYLAGVVTYTTTSIATTAYRVKIDAASYWSNSDGYDFTINGSFVRWYEVAGRDTSDGAGGYNNNPILDEARNNYVEDSLASRLASSFSGIINSSIVSSSVLISTTTGNPFSLSVRISRDYGDPAFQFITDTGSARASLQTALFSPLLQVRIDSDDPDGISTSYKYSWQRSADNLTWTLIDNQETAAYSLVESDQGFWLRGGVAYIDAGGFEEFTSTNSEYVSLINNGKASFSISGAANPAAPVVGETLIAAKTSDDADGNGSGGFTYSWQTSINGTTWSPVGTNSASYTVTATDEGKQIRVGISYTDGQGFMESFTSAPQSVARLNKQPTGTPTLSGTFKVGQIITIDKTPIQDADNFTGYTPTYNYSFEVSNDNGSSWTKLTSTDATDNNITYTLTTSEVGKKVRGVVSYMDGYGTNEAVPTAGSSVTSAPVVRGNSLYTIVDGPSWTQAEANSVKLGGHLTSISSKSENDLVQELAKLNSDPLLTWIGGTDEQKEGVWKWTTGEPWAYTNWSASEPTNNAWNAGIAENYLAIYKADGTWNDNFSGNWAEYTTTRGIAETPFVRRGDSAYVIVQGPTWEEAEANAVKLGGHLVTINDASEEQFLLKNTSLGGWIGYTDKAVEGQWRWIDGTPKGYERWDNANPSNNNGAEHYAYLDVGAYFGWGAGWNDVPNSAGMSGIAEINLAPNNTPTGTPTLSETFKPGQVITIDRTPIQDTDNFNGYTPTYNYSFEVSNDNGTTWTKLTTTDATDNNSTYTLTTAEVGKKVRGVVSYLDGYGTKEVVSTAGSSVSSAPFVRGNSLYTIINAPATWSSAEADAVKIGGHLATIDDNSENDFIKLFSASYGQDILIGYHKVNGEWQWSSGLKSSFTKWAHPTGQWSSPDNWLGIENVASMYLRKVYGEDWSGWWNDVPDDGRAVYGTNTAPALAETPFIRRGDSAYVVVQGPTWEEAEANAVKLGGHLVTINDAAENEWIASTLLGETIQVGDAFWIGISDSAEEGNFQWQSGQNSSYRNWFPGEPSNDGGDADFGQIWNFNNRPGQSAGTWNDAPTSNVWTYRGIAEIKFAPNSIPTGTPTLSGTFKAGQIITIDRTPIQDTDNFSGYTPTYNYSFEISGDNGTTWTKLTSADATDNNSTYTLTTAEVGKQVRGVVSCLDGYGTNESVASDPSTLVVGNQAPTELSLSSSTFNENIAASSQIGTLSSTDPDSGNTFAYSLVSGTGSTDSAAFTINGNQLKINASPDFESKSAYIIRVRTTDQDGLFFEKNLNLGVVNVNEAPTNLSLITSGINENSPSGTLIGTLAATDPDAGSTCSYALVTGNGTNDADNNLVEIVNGNEVRVKSGASIDFETNPQLNLNIQVTDNGGLTFTKAVTATVLNVNEAPTNLSLITSGINENSPAGTVIGTLAATDPDVDPTFTYALAAGNGINDSDNALLEIVGNQVRVKSGASIDFETNPQLNLNIQVTDNGGLTFTKAVAAAVLNVSESSHDNSTDITPPEVISTITNGKTVILKFSESITAESLPLTALSVVSISKNNSETILTISSVAVDRTDATRLILTVSPYASSSQVRVVYIDPASNQLTGVIQDLAGNDLASFPAPLTLASSRTTVLPSQHQRLVLIGSNNINGTGNALDNHIYGNDYNNILDGLTGADQMAGGMGNDVYVVDNAGDLVLEELNEGSDLVKSSISYALGANLEHLALIGSASINATGNELSNTLTGNDSGNVLIGGSGSDTLNGGLGADTLTGQAGVDTFQFALRDSILASYDRITDFVIGVDILDGPSAVTAANLRELDSVSSLTQASLSSILTTRNFARNSAATFSLGAGPSARTFLALNDKTAGFSPAADSIIEITGYAGTLADLAII